MTSAPPPYAYPHPGPPPELPELPEGVERTSPLPGWPAWTAPLALIAGFAAAIAGFIAIAIVAALAGVEVASDNVPPGINIAATFFQDGALVASALLFARMASRPRAADFGLRPTRFAPALGWTALTYVGFLVFGAIWAGILGGIDQQDDLPSELGADKSTTALVAVMVLVTVAAPIAEEFFFRGYFFTALRTWRGPLVAAVLTGLVFGGIHAGSAPVPYLVPLAALGFGLCLLYWRTGSLYPCMALHCVNNSIAFGVTQHWGVEILGLAAGANLAIAAIVLPFAGLRAGRRRVA